MKQIFLVKAGTTAGSTAAPLGDFDDWILSGLALGEEPCRIVDALGGELPPSPEACSGVVVSGSHAMVTDNLPWSLALEKWIRELVHKEVPFLGICYGHQLLGRALGGRVGYHPAGPETGTVHLELTPEGLADRLFAGVPQCFPAHVTHAQSVLELPPGAVRLASNAHEPNHAIRVGRYAWGVQFHPEYSTSIMNAYILMKDEAGREESEQEKLLEGVVEAPDARLVLTNFARLCRHHS